MSQFTAGPWKATRSCPAEGADVWWITAGEGNGEVEIGTVPGGYPHAHHEANARLIAAAPDLYAACAEFVRKVDAGEARSRRSYAQMKDVLRIARGDSD